MKKFKKRELEKEILILRKEIWNINRIKDIIINECNKKDYSLKLCRMLIKEDITKEKALNNEIEKLKKEIELYQSEHEKQEMFQNSVYKEKQNYKELYEILTEKYKKLNLASKKKDTEIEDLKDSLKQYARNTFSRIGEVEKLKRDIIHLKKEREILYQNSSDENFVDKILKDKKMYYSILSVLVIINIFLFKIM